MLFHFLRVLTELQLKRKITLFLFHWNMEYFKQIKTKGSNSKRHIIVKSKFEGKKEKLFNLVKIIDFCNKYIKFYASRIKNFTTFMKPKKIIKKQNEAKSLD